MCGNSIQQCPGGDNVHHLLQDIGGQWKSPFIWFCDELHPSWNFVDFISQGKSIKRFGMENGSPKMLQDVNGMRMTGDVHAMPHVVSVPKGCRLSGFCGS